MMGLGPERLLLISMSQIKTQEIKSSMRRLGKFLKAKILWDRLETLDKQPKVSPKTLK